jgi:hypothetical protein
MRVGVPWATTACLVSALATSGCLGIDVTSTPLNEPVANMKPRSADSVEIFASGPPAQPHVDVALLHAYVYAFQTRDDVVTALRTEAAKMGCDALVITSIQMPKADAACVVYTAARRYGRTQQ